MKQRKSPAIYMFKRVPRRVKLSSSPLHIAVYLKKEKSPESYSSFKAKNGQFREFMANNTS